MVSSSFFRYHWQDFIDIAEEDYPKVAEMGWTKTKDLESFLEDIQQSASKKTLLIPHLMGSTGYECLRLKVINSEEYDGLMEVDTAEIERVESVCGEVVFFFGFEDQTLGDGPGLLYAYWAKNPSVAKLQVSYAFAEASLNAFGLGFGSRGAVPSLGLNGYFKDDGRGSKRPFSSPLQADEDINKQQYYRENFKDQLVQPRLRRIINELADNVSGITRAVNPALMLDKNT
jgi:hypothetical protein